LGALRVPTRRRLLAGLRAVSRRLMSPPRLTTEYYHTTGNGWPHCAAQQIGDFDVRYGSKASFRALWPMSVITPKATRNSGLSRVAACKQATSALVREGGTSYSMNTWECPLWRALP
jgi:hypothetical protein